MKKIFLAVAAVFCMSLFSACGNGSSSATEANADSTVVAVDSLASDSIAVDSIAVDSVSVDSVR
jgi:ABC-type phosphate/phosphonate transport system substrate-binding protein